MNISKEITENYKTVVGDDYCLIQGDCLEVMRQLPDNSVDVIITDPPYGINKADWDSAFPAQWIDDGWRIAPRMLVMSGSSSLLDAGNALGKYRECLVMHARNGMTRSKISFGNWFPVLACGDWKWEARPNYLPFNVSIKEKIDHPTPKPLASMLLLLQKYTKIGEVVLDPFMGSGTTGVAARMLCRKFIGIELDPDYFDIAVKRISAPVQKEIFLPIESNILEETQIPLLDKL